MDTRNITLKITASQYRNGEKSPEKVELITEGTMLKKGDLVYLSYDETEFSGIEGCKTCLILDENSVHMQRIGSDESIGTQIAFQEGLRYDGLYETPHGAIEMEVLTHKLKNDFDSEGRGEIDIDYRISLKGLSEGRSHLNIRVM